MNKAQSKLLDIFSKLEKDIKPLNSHYNSKVLLIDGMNTFLRSFAVSTNHNGYGNHVGGLIGFLKSIGSAIKIIQPTRCIIVFDGEGGSVNRKYLYPEYKGNRDNKRLMNYKSFNNKEEEKQSQVDEITRLIDYLDCLPLSLISEDRLEADDVIGYLSNKIYTDYDDSQVYIMSTDNDFLQLVNDRRFVYSPTKKITYDIERVFNEFSIHPENFVVYKALVGDTSDNIPGVSGVGEKNVSVLFEGLKTDERKNLDYIFEVCKNPPKKSILYEKILELDGMVNIFYKIVNIREPNISDNSVEEINNKFYTKVNPVNRNSFVSLLRHDRISDPSLNSENWIRLFSTLHNF